MPPAGLNVLNNGTGDGIAGATTDPSVPSAGIHGINSASGLGSTNLPGVNSPAGVFGESTLGDGIGVVGWSSGPIGIRGIGTRRGVEGLGNMMGVYGGSNGSGVHAEGGGAGVAAIGIGSYGVWAKTIPGSGRGVYGNADETNGVGVEGDSNSGVGVEGNTESGTGVWGYSRTGVGVRASTDGERAGWALLTDGDVMIRGNIYVSGPHPKSALVKLRDGSQRALYCVESPECWFEDFGRSRLIRGKAQVRLDPIFAAVIRTSDYHVFLSPEGMSQGLYISHRMSQGFEVREQHRGTSTVPFSYRIVGHRKDVQAPRFKRMKLPAVPKATRPSRPKLVHIGQPSKGQLPKIPGVTRLPELARLLRTRNIRSKVTGRRPRAR